MIEFYDVFCVAWKDYLTVRSDGTGPIIIDGLDSDSASGGLI